MKIVQTFWPCDDSASSLTQPLGIKAGWRSAQLHWMSWALSCLQLRKYYDEVELVTNDLGKKILIDTLRLPYTHVSTALENNFFKSLRPELWAVSKVYSYGLQKKPFIHVDGDVYIFDYINPEIVKRPLIAQNLEVNLHSYLSILKIVKESFSYLPPFMVKEQKLNSEIVACNAGILGGSDLAFFKEYSELVFKFIAHNNNHLSKVYHDKFFNTVLEQYFFASLAGEKGIDISCLYEPIKEGESFGVFVDIYATPFKSKYIHILGPFKEVDICFEFVARKLRHFHPDHYYHILDVLKTNDPKSLLPLYKSSNVTLESLRQSHSPKMRGTSIKRVSSICNEEKDNVNFRRTKALLKEYLGIQNIQLSASASPDQQLRSIQNYIESIQDKSSKLILRDVFKFEKTKNKFVKSLKNDIQLYKKSVIEERDTLTILGLEEDKFLEQELVLDNGIQIININRDWRFYLSETSLFDNQISKKYLRSIVLLKPNIFRLGIQEVLISNLHFYVYRNFKRKKAICDVLNDIENNISIEDDLELDGVKLTVEKIIKRAIYEGILIKG